MSARSTTDSCSAGGLESACKRSPVAWKARVLSRGEVVPDQIEDDVLEHQIDWLQAQCDRADKAVLVLEDGAAPPIPLFVHDGQIDFDLGEIALGNTKVRRHVLVGNFRETLAVDWAEVFLALKGVGGGNSVIFLLGVVCEEGLYRALSDPRLRTQFHVLQHGVGYKRRLCDIGSGFENYLGSLSAKSRQSMKRSLRRFEADFKGRFAFDVYVSPPEVTKFLEAVEPVSKRTYQARMLGLAVTRDGYIGTRARAGAERGYTRCYVLTVDGEPIAWRIGFQSGSVFSSHHIGYDPAFEEWHPGVLMHIFSIRHMTESLRDVAVLDLLYGDNDFKRRASNRSRDEQNYYLFPRTFRGSLTYACLAVCNALSGTVGSLLERAGLKAKLKAALRRG